MALKIKLNLLLLIQDVTSACGLGWVEFYLGSSAVSPILFRQIVISAEMAEQPGKNMLHSESKSTQPESGS